MIQLKPIAMPNVPELIIRQLLEQLHSGEINPGDQLPSEQLMHQLLQIPKPQVKLAFQKMERYRIVTTVPQKGRYLAKINRKVLIGLMENVLNVDPDHDAIALLDVRIPLEVQAVKLAAQHRSASEVKRLERANEDYLSAVNDGSHPIGDDFFFHMELVRCCHNSLLISLYSFITMEMINFWQDLPLFDHRFARQTLQEVYLEHQQIIATIQSRDGEQAGVLMLKHIHRLRQAAEQQSRRTSKGAKLSQRG